MNELQHVFNYENLQVRMVMIENEPWFVARDICEILGFERTNDTTKHLEDDEKGTTIYRTRGGNQEMTIINEPGLYSLIFRSRKPEAKQFKRWITHEVLPSIRKNGMYLTTEVAQEAIEDTDALLARAVVVAKERLERAQRELEAAKPAIEMVNRYVNAEGLMTLREVAKILNIPERTFSRLLIDRGIIYHLHRKWMPAAMYQSKGYFEVKTSEKGGIVYTQAKFTPAGFYWISNLVSKRGWYEQTAK